MFLFIMYQIILFNIFLEVFCTFDNSEQVSEQVTGILITDGFYLFLEFTSELKKSSSISSLDSAFTEGVSLLMSSPLINQH